MPRPFRTRSSALAVPVVLALTGCGGGSEPPAAGAPSGDTVQGTVAEQWATGEAGLGEPPTTPPPGWDQSLLNLAVTTAQRHLLAANLDETVLYGGDTEPFINSLVQQNRDPVRQQIESKDDDAPAYNWLTRFSPGTRADGPVRVTGKWAVSEGQDGGRPVLVLEWRGSFVYPVTDGKQQTAVPAQRTVLWRWVKEGGWPSVGSFLMAGQNLNGCESFESELFSPDYRAKDLAKALENPYGEGNDYKPEPPDCSETPAA